jgi:starch phosphorylase
MEYGLHADFTIYAGGLGVLAGDYMKAAGDHSAPIVGIGLLWDLGYTEQRIGRDNWPTDGELPTRRDALELVDVEVFVTVRGEEVACRVWKVKHYVDAPLYLLEPRSEQFRWITRRLYGGGKEDRIAQEMLLGIGGVRLLRSLGIDVDIYHFNEGHAVLAGLELMRELRSEGASFDESWQAIRDRIVFTTHTPVPAGNETHSLELLEYSGATLVHTAEELSSIGGSPFSMTVAGLRMSCRANAVSQLHGETARGMWRHVDGGAPIAGITNGVHVPTWQDARTRAAVVQDKPAGDRESELWSAHQRMKGELLDYIAETANHTFDRDKLLIGFARRSAAYKRAPLILSDRGRIGPLLESGRVQLVFSGKAHPADQQGKQIIKELASVSDAYDSVVYLENYNMEIGALLTRGCDVWLNNPRRPMEASGTSGMKAAMNGVLNLSILDGWWPEGCRHGVTGWQIGGVEEAHDERDRAALYDVLENEVIPRYYDSRDTWVNMMLASIEMSQWRFSSARMLEDYYRRLYRPSSG